uniref:Uncharacterized protein n=1 Tax=Oryza punctata TaxID=4537 RepID=A0A0E0LPF0_ORYPU
MHVTAEAKNPASCVTAGIARIPAPTYGINSCRKIKISEDDKTNITVVPATRKIELVTLPDIQTRNGSITVHLKGKRSMHKEVERSMLCLTRFVLHGCLVEIGEEALQLLLLRAG